MVAGIWSFDSLSFEVFTKAINGYIIVFIEIISVCFRVENFPGILCNSCGIGNWNTMSLYFFDKMVLLFGMLSVLIIAGISLRLSLHHLTTGFFRKATSFHGKFQWIVFCSAYVKLLASSFTLLV